MTITLDRPTTSTIAPRTRSAAPRLQRVGGTASRPVATEDAVTITVSVSLPAGTGDVEAALIADELRTRAQRLVAETAEGMAAARFVARPDEGKVCGTCPVRTSCPARDEGMMLR